MSGSRTGMQEQTHPQCTLKGRCRYSGLVLLVESGLGCFVSPAVPRPDAGVLREHLWWLDSFAVWHIGAWLDSAAPRPPKRSVLLGCGQLRPPLPSTPQTHRLCGHVLQLRKASSAPGLLGLSPGPLSQADPEAQGSVGGSSDPSSPQGRGAVTSPVWPSRSPWWL